MPEQSKNYSILKEILDRVGQTEFLKTYGSLDDIYQIQLNFIYATCKYYDTQYSNNTEKKCKMKTE